MRQNDPRAIRERNASEPRANPTIREQYANETKRHASDTRAIRERYASDPNDARTIRGHYAGDTQRCADDTRAMRERRANDSNDTRTTHENRLRLCLHRPRWPYEFWL